MATNKNVNTTSNLPAVATTNAPDTEFLKSLGGGALEDISARDIIMPRFKLVQPTSRKGTPGKWISNVSDVEYDYLDVAILNIGNYQIYFPAAGEGDKPLCKSNNGLTKASPDGIGDGKCANCRFNVWTKDANGNSVPPKCRSGYSILGFVFAPDGTMTPGVISIKGAAIKSAKQYFTKMKTRGFAPFSYITRIGAVSEVNAKGRFFKSVMDFATDAEGNDISWLPKEVVLDLANQAKNYSQYIGTDVMVDADYEVEAEAPSSGAQDFLNSLGKGSESSEGFNFN